MKKLLVLAALFIVHYTKGPAWDDALAPNKQKYFAEHSAHLRKLRTDGVLVMGARYGDKGMLVVNAATAEEAKQLFAADPSLAHGTFAMTLDELKPFYDGCVERPPAPAK